MEDGKTTGAGQADGAGGDDAPVTTAQEQAWFDEDDDGGTASAGQDGDGDGAAEDGDGKQAAQPADDGDGDGKPAAEAGKDAGTPADGGKPAEPAKPEDGKPAGAAKPEGAAADADGGRQIPSPWDLDAAVGKALAEPMPDKVKVGDSEVDVKQFLADFPEVQAVAATMARRVVEQVLEPIIPAIHVANQVQAERYHAAFMGEVEGKFPGASETAQSPEFKSWVAKQPKPIQDMASVYDVDSAVFVLQQFRAAVPTAAGSGNGKPPRQATPASPAFQRRKEALAGTVSGKPATPGAGDAPADDYEAAFNED